MPLVVTVHEAGRIPRGSLVCSVCGYGIALATPPGPCPMCRADDAWVGSAGRVLAAPAGGGPFSSV